MAAYDLIDLHPDVASLEQEVLAGLRQSKKTLSPKLFYDEEGSRLFEEITRLPEYYLTRTEISILHRVAPDIAALMGRGCALVELGSGNSTKVRILLDIAQRPLTYMPVDISRQQLEQAAAAIAGDYPGVEVVAVCTDYATNLVIPGSHRYARRVIFFPGSTIGNFEPAAARSFLALCASQLREGDAVIIGADLKKSKAILDAAYDDPAGVTARFNLNLLGHLNRELGADFDLGAFQHVAFYNESAGRIEMYLRSLRPQLVHIAGESIAIGAGEEIHTENSYKYDVDELQALASEGGLQPLAVWTDPDRLFSVHAFTR